MDESRVRMVADQRGPAIRALAESGKERSHWRGRHPEFPGVTFLFEAVIDDGEHWAIRHMELQERGKVLRYWWEHLEDRDGFLVECPLEPEEWGLESLTEADFEAAWHDGGANPVAT